MSVTRSILLRMFGRPQGVLGQLGGAIMARTNAGFGNWVSGLLDMEPNDRVLEVGFGPGMVVSELARRAPNGRIAGVDPSREMVEQAHTRNAAAIDSGRVDLRQGSVDSLPFDDGSFDKALAINSMQVWPDAAGGLREVRRVLRPGGRIALGFTRHSGQPKEGVPDMLAAAGFVDGRVIEQDHGFCALAAKPPGA